MTNRKLVIPAILTATILVAGMFAIMPVQKAETIHVGIIAAIQGTSGFGLTDIGLSTTVITIDTDTTWAANELYLLYDGTPAASFDGHIAVQLPCDDDAGPDFAFRVLEGNAETGAPPLTPIVLTFITVVNAGSGVDDTFDALCVGHADFIAEGPDFVLENQTDEAGIGDAAGEAVSLEGSVVSIRAT